ncbi:6-pyruvoyl tetrahydropterin synthase family protein [Bacteroidota bacterium]
MQLTPKRSGNTVLIINFKILKKIIKKEVVEKVDHKNLDMDVEFLKGKMTSCENLVISFWDLLKSKIEEASGGRTTLHCIKLYETPTSFAEYYG